MGASGALDGSANIAGWQAAQIRRMAIWSYPGGLITVPGNRVQIATLSASYRPPVTLTCTIVQ